jgi:nicotinamidase/pyrazinamidase
MSKYRMDDTVVLVVVEVHDNSCPGDSLPVSGSGEVVPTINVLAQRFRHIVLTQDWQPAGHRSFASAHPGRQPFQSIELAYGSQVLWPDHCVQDTPGAQGHAGLLLPHAELVLCES